MTHKCDCNCGCFSRKDMLEIVWAWRIALAHSLMLSGVEQIRYIGTVIQLFDIFLDREQQYEAIANCVHCIGSGPDIQICKEHRD